MDADCSDGLACANPVIAGSDRVCINSCNSDDDCGPLWDTTWVIEVGLTFAPMFGEVTTNYWNTPVLTRGVACIERDFVAGSGAPKFCHFICPEFAAVAGDSDGYVTGCACLPGYRTTSDGGGCEPNPDIECNILDSFDPDQLAAAGIQGSGTVCDACNSDLDKTDSAGCHTGRFGCDIVGDGLEGKCREVINSDEFWNCLNSQIYTACDCQCPTPDACWSDASDCACCTCTNSNTPTPRPKCTQ